MNLDAIEAAAKAATPGPWTAEEGDSEEFWFGDGYWGIGPEPGGGGMVAIGFGEADAKNAPYIAAADPQTVLALVAIARAARVAHDNLGEPTPDYPAPVAFAHDALHDALRAAGLVE